MIPTVNTAERYTLYILTTIEGDVFRRVYWAMSRAFAETVPAEAMPKPSDIITERASFAALLRIIADYHAERSMYRKDFTLKVDGSELFNGVFAPM